LYETSINLKCLGSDVTTVFTKLTEINKHYKFIINKTGLLVSFRVSVASHVCVRVRVHLRASLHRFVLAKLSELAVHAFRPAVQQRQVPQFVACAKKDLHACVGK
jgi:uncharacterized Fe-S cluster-containing radical SAM superfamily protein